jgi:hypothetical protein
MEDFRDLKVWQQGHQLTLAVYKATAKLPDNELYGRMLASLIRRLRG